jgi:hypothetical protein
MLRPVEAWLFVALFGKQALTPTRATSPRLLVTLGQIQPVESGCNGSGVGSLGRSEARSWLVHRSLRRDRGDVLEFPARLVCESRTHGSPRWQSQFQVHTSIRQRSRSVHGVLTPSGSRTQLLDALSCSAHSRHARHGSRNRRDVPRRHRRRDALTEGS